MKKLLLTFLAVGSIAAAKAQTGTLLVYANSGLGNMSTIDPPGLGFRSVTNADKSTSISFNINPGIGYQFSPRWTIGVSGGYNMISDKTNDPLSFNADTKSSYWQAGAFLRYTKTINSVFAVFGQVDIAYSSSKTNTTYPGTATIDGPKTTGFGAMVTPAVSITIPNWFAMNFSFGGLSYMTSNTESGLGQPSTSGNEFRLTFGQTINVGIQRNFGCGWMHHHMHGNMQPGDDMRHMDTSDDDDDAPRSGKKSKMKKMDKDDDE